MTPIACPQCGSEAVWFAAYESGVRASCSPRRAYTCNDCGHKFVANEWWPDCDDDDICNADDPIIDDEDAAYAPPADSRSDDARD